MSGSDQPLEGGAGILNDAYFHGRDGKVDEYLEQWFQAILLRLWDFARAASALATMLLSAAASLNYQVRRFGNDLAADKSRPDTPWCPIDPTNRRRKRCVWVHLAQRRLCVSGSLCGRFLEQGFRVAYLSSQSSGRSWRGQGSAGS